MSTKVTISEVGPRDGLQSLAQVMPLSAKKAWIAAEAAAGVGEIEVGSFVPKKLLPQMADTAQLVAFAKTLPNLEVAVLVPNLRGAERAIEAGADKISIPFSMSETHSLNNVRKNHARMLEEIRAIADLVNQQPTKSRPYFEVGLSTAFGCTMEGPISADAVTRLAEKTIAAGAMELCLSDTTGYANPAQVRNLSKQVKNAVGANKLNSLHLHNTRGLGLANVVAGLEAGITTFDASLCGLGGCPFAPGASGNIVTEDLAFMLNAMGLDCGIDLDALLKVRTILANALPDEPLYGFTADAGVPLGYLSSSQSAAAS
ncbi:MAG: hydroxymethylglutaryl-CoA lyase [Erythrobacter sp.]|uniref:hydroxymethylglutaryl-CoA lyase n=1 Tax=Erythrobacter sp. TaxID=1042 RepID=UPI0032646608